MTLSELGNNPPPFWRQFRFFFNYLKQEKLYFQITLLAFANVLIAIPIFFLSLLFAGLLFLISYKLAFEVLHAVSSGQLIYGDDHRRKMDDKIGFKAISMGVFQLLLYFFVYPNSPATGLALMILSLVATPAFLMMLSQTQSLTSSFNPLNLITVISRIGFEYVILLGFFLLCAAANMTFRFYMKDLMPGVIGSVVSAWVLYFLLVFTFLVIGYVMYRHADELGHETDDVEVLPEDSLVADDPIKDRIKKLIAENNPTEAINIINEIKQSEQRIDLDSYLAQAENMKLLANRQRPVEKFQKLFDAQNYNAAIKLVLSYIEDGHFIKPKDVSCMSQLINHSFINNQFNTVLKLCRNFEQRYPLEHQDIVDNYFLVAKINHQNNKIEQAEKLLHSLVKKYSQTANTAAPKSYLIGIQKQNKDYQG